MSQQDTTTPETAPTVAATTPVGDYEEFSNVFDSLTDKDGAANAENTEADQTNSSDLPAANAADPADQAAGAGDPAQPEAPGADPAAANGAGSQDDKGGVADGGDQGAQGVDWEARFKALEAKIGQPAPAPVAATPVAEEAAPAPVYTTEEQAELADLQKDWPEVQRLFTLMARQLQVDTLNYAFSEVGKVLTPLQQSVQTYSTDSHMGAIYDAHDDYEQVYQPVMDWIEAQPGFLKTAYQNVVEQGSAEDVIQLIQRFKDETKWAATASTSATGAPATTATAAAPTPAQQKQTELSEAAKKAAKAMGAVGAKRSAGTTNAQDPNDFDGTWEAINAA